MYVCVCHGISETRLNQAIQEGARSFEQLQSCTGVATCCGACEPAPARCSTRPLIPSREPLRLRDLRGRWPRPVPRTTCRGVRP